MRKITYARLVDKEEAKRIKKLGTIGIAQTSELVPAFEATYVLDSLFNLKPDEIKILNKTLGGKGNATRIILFVPEKEPIVSNIPFRNIGKIRALIGYSIRESKFLPDTKIKIKDII